jgi:hypothetical protein
MLQDGLSTTPKLIEKLRHQNIWKTYLHISGSNWQYIKQGMYSVAVLYALLFLGGRRIYARTVEFVKRTT